MGGPSKTLGSVTEWERRRGEEVIERDQLRFDVC
jgi:hypothetical protein